jgi:hypothetical protein
MIAQLALPLLSRAGYAYSWSGHSSHMILGEMADGKSSRVILGLNTSHVKIVRREGFACRRGTRGRNLP